MVCDVKPELALYDPIIKLRPDSCSDPVDCPDCGRLSIKISLKANRQVLATML